MNLEPPVPNLPLLRKVLAQIDQHPEEWNQQEWFTETACGTAACVAGHACLMSGDKPGGDECPTTGVVITVNTADGSVLGVQERAQSLLGLTDGECDMFDPENTRADIQRYAEQIAARAGERL